MRATVVQEQKIQAIRKSLREGVDEELKALSVQIGPFEKKALPRSRSHSAIHVELFEDVLNLSSGLDAAGGQASPAHGQ